MIDQKRETPSDLSPAAKRELLARLLEKKIGRAEGWVPLSYSQKTYWDREQCAPGTAVCTEAFAVRTNGDIDVGILRAFFQELTVRHPCLRTIYKSLAGEPAQRILERQEVVVHATDAAAWSQDEFQTQFSADAHRPFDLANGPVCDIHLYKRSVKESIILTKIHHLAIDLRSMAVLMEELKILFLSRLTGMAHALPSSTADYMDFVRHQEQYLKGPESERDWKYWQQQLAPPLSGLELPTDQPRPATSSYRGATLPVELDAELTTQLRGLAKEEQTTLFATLLTGYKAMLCLNTGQEDILIGTRTAGRSRQEFMRTVGCFVNPTALRTDLSGQPSFRTVLRRVRQTVQEALTHQEYPYAHLLNRLSPPVGSAPLCNAVFVLLQPQAFSSDQTRYETADSFGVSSQARSGGGIGLGDRFIEIFPVQLQSAYHDLELELTEANSGLLGWMRYRLDLFDEVTVARLLEHFIRLLKAMVAAPDRRITESSLD